MAQHGLDIAVDIARTVSEAAAASRSISIDEATLELVGRHEGLAYGEGEVRDALRSEAEAVGLTLL
jgi:hypothetical protein